jgi:hypothetical protein
MDSRTRRGIKARTFAAPVLLIMGLLAAHLVLSDWSALANRISTTLAAIG